MTDKQHKSQTFTIATEAMAQKWSIKKTKRKFPTKRKKKTKKQPTKDKKRKPNKNC